MNNLNTEDAAQWHVARRKRRRRGCAALVLTPVLVVGMIVGWFGIRLFDQPKITRNFTAEMNEAILSSPEGDRGWPLYKQAKLLQLEHRLPDELSDQWPIYPGWERWPDAVAWLEDEQHILDLVREASRKPVLGRALTSTPDPDIAAAEAKVYGGQYTVVPAEENPMLINVLLPELGTMRNFVRTLVVDTHRALENDETERGIENIEAMLNIAFHSRESGTLIGQLVQVAIESLACQTTLRVMESYPDQFNDDRLARLQDAFMTNGRFDPPNDGGLTRIDLDMTLERAFFYDMVQRIYSDNGNGDGHMTMEGVKQLNYIDGMGSGSFENLTTPMMVLMAASRKDLTDKYESFMTAFEEAASQRPWDRDGAMGQIEQDIELLSADPIERMRYALITMLMPALSRAVNSLDLIDTQRDGTIAAIAIRRWQLTNGALPASLDQLVPGLIPALPLDPVDGEPLRYAVIDGRATLYSLGGDGDDDGGAAGEDPRNTRPGRYNADDGDWIVVPAPAVEEPVEE